MSGLTNNPIELLVILGVNSAKSLENINDTITKLASHRDLKKLQVEIDIKANPDFVKNLAKNLSEQLKGVKDDADNLNATLANLGAGTGNKHDDFGSMRSEINKTFTSLKELENYLKNNNYKYKVEFAVDDAGNKFEKSVTAYMKNAYGEIERLNFTPVVNAEGTVESFKQVGAAVENIDTFKLQDNIKKATVTLEDFGRKGVLAAKDYTHFEDAIRGSNTNQELERVMANLNKFTKDATFDYKFANSIEKAKNTLIDFGRQGILTAHEYSHFKKAIESSKTNQELEKVVMNLKEFGKDVTLSDKLKNSMTTVNTEVNQLNHSIDRFLNKNAKNADLSTFGRLKDELKEIQNTVVYTEKEAQKLKQRLNEVKGQITTATASGNDLKTFDNRANQINKLIKTIERLPKEIGISEKAIATMYRQIENVPRGDLNQLEKHFARIQRISSDLTDKKIVLNGIDTNINNVARLNAQLERAYNLNKRYADKTTYRKLQQEIVALSQEQITHARHVDGVINKYRKLSQEVAKFSAAATQESRNSMTILNQLKIALERFPIWMIASTAFYSVVRTTRAFIDTLVEIDSKLVSIEKVAGSMDMGSIFDSAIDSAERFGQSISSVLDAYAEFARQGYKGQDLVELSSAGLVTANVGEIDAQKASEYLTSALIQWNKETSEAMGIIDSWNEIANNYATTVEKLAAGHGRAASTAKSMGMSFDELNSVIATVTAATKQSGDEVGKCNCPLLW